MQVPRAPHRWSVSPLRATAIQRRLAVLVRSVVPPAPLRWIAGLDAAVCSDGTRCVAAAVLWDAQARKVVEERIARRPVTFPYVPGLLSFREAPAVLAAVRQLRRAPDVILYDGHGLAHPRRFGIACHVGLLAGIPTIGCAKSRLVGEHAEPGALRGASVPLFDRGEIVGRVVRTRDHVRPVFVSVGHLIDLETAERVVLDCAPLYRIPEPIRLADHLVREKSRKAGRA
jgi:deoxyribonuclease V